MNKVIGKTFAVTLAIVCMAESALAAGPQCRREQYALRKETSEERKAEGNLIKITRNAEALLRRHESEVNKQENLDQRYQIQKERLEESTARQVDALENQRVNYVAQIAELTAVLGFCLAEDFFDDFLGLPDRSCNPERINTQIVRIGKQVTTVELRIASAHSRRDRYLESYQKQYEAASRSQQTRVARALTRLQEGQAKIPPFQAAYDQAVAERAAADQVYQTCIGNIG